MTALATDVGPGSGLPGRSHWPWAGALALVAFALAVVTRADPDLWGHLRFGLDMLASRHLTAMDPYSFTQDRPWINHEWLSEVQMALAYRALGSAGLPLFKAALVFGAFWLAWDALRGVDVGPRLAMMLLLVLGSVHVTSSMRPQVWTFVFQAIECRALMSTRPSARRALPVLFALWANCHGGWVVGLGVLAVWAVAFVFTERALLVEWAVILVTSASATLATPYGWRLWLFIAQTVRMTRSITEWQPLLTTPFLNWVPWFVAVAAIPWAAWRSPTHRAPVAAVLTMLAYCSARVMRIESLFVIAAAILLAPSLANTWPEVRRRAIASSPFEMIVASAILSIPVVLSAWLAAPTLKCLPTIGTWRPDAAAIPFLRAEPPGRVVTYFDWGEYTIWHLGPRLLVSSDGRRETVYSDRRLAESDAIVAGTPLGFDTLSTWKAEYVWLPATSNATRDWLATHGYRIDLRTERSFVAVRNDLPVVPTITTPFGSGCFPD